MDFVVIPNMANGTVRLKSRDLIDRFEKSMYRVSKDGDLPYSTVHRLVSEADEIGSVNGDTLFGFLMGLGLTIDEAKRLPLGDVFDFVEFEESTE